MRADPEDRRSGARRPVRRRRLWRWLFIVLVLISAAVAALPRALRYGVEHVLYAMGASQVRIAGIALEPLRKGFVANNLAVRMAQGYTLQVPEVRVQLGWAPVWRKQLRVTALEADHATIVFAPAEAEHGAQPSGSPAGTGSGWQYTLDRAELRDSVVQFRDASLPGAPQAKLQELVLTALHNGQPQQPAHLQVRAAIDAAPLQVEADLMPYARRPQVTGRLKLTGLPLAPYVPLLESQLTTLSGTLDIDTDIEARRTSGGDLRLVQQGSVALSGLRAGRGSNAAGAGQLQWNGTLWSEGGAALKLHAEGRLHGKALEASLPGRALSAQGGRLEWEGHAELVGGSDTRLMQEGRLHLEQVQAHYRGDDLEEQSLDWEGRLEAANAATGAAHLSLKGTLHGSGMQAALRSRNARLTHAGLTWVGEIGARREASGATSFTQAGQVVIDQVRGEGTFGVVEEDRLSWNGTVDLALPPVDAPQLTLDGRLEGAALHLHLADAGLRIEHQALVSQGRLQYSGAPDQVQFEGQVAVRALNVYDPALGVALLRLQALELQDVRGAGGAKVDIGRIHLLRPQLAQRLAPRSSPTDGAPAPLFQAADATLTEVTFDPLRELSVREGVFQDASALLRRDVEGRFRLVEDIVHGLAPEGRSANGVGFTFRAGGVQLLGHSTLRFVDQSVSPPYRSDVPFTEVRVGTLDSSSPDAPSPLRLVARSGDFSRVSLEGSIRPFAPRLTLDVHGQLRSVDLPGLSPYAARVLGYDVTSGQMDAQIDLRILQGELDGASTVDLENLRVEPAAGTPERQLTQALRMPLGTALDLLRGPNKSVALHAPISGDITSPELEFSDAAARAVGGALRVAAVSYLKYALAPYGALLAVTQAIGQQLGAVRLAAVFFAPGSAELDAGALKYLDQVAQLLRKRPQLELRLCGRAVPADRQAPAPAAGLSRIPPENGSQNPPPDAAADQRMSDLAQERARAVRRRLLKEAGIVQQRLFDCAPEVDATEGARPRVDLRV